MNILDAFLVFKPNREIFVEVWPFVVAGLIAVSVPLGVLWYCVRRFYRWNATKDLNRMLRKEDAIKSMGANRVWSEIR